MLDWGYHFIHLGYAIRLLCRHLSDFGTSVAQIKLRSQRARERERSREAVKESERVCIGCLWQQQQLQHDICCCCCCCSCSRLSSAEVARSLRKQQQLSLKLHASSSTGFCLNEEASSRFFRVTFRAYYNWVYYGLYNAISRSSPMPQLKCKANVKIITKKP